MIAAILARQMGTTSRQSLANVSLRLNVHLLGIKPQVDQTRFDEIRGRTRRQFVEGLMVNIPEVVHREIGT